MTGEVDPEGCRDPRTPIERRILEARWTEIVAMVTNRTDFEVAMIFCALENDQLASRHARHADEYWSWAGRPKTNLIRIIEL